MEDLPWKISTTGKSSTKFFENQQKWSHLQFSLLIFQLLRSDGSPSNDCHLFHSFPKVSSTTKILNLRLLLHFHFIRYLSPCSVVANVAQFMGLGIVFYYIFCEQLPHSYSVHWLSPSDRLPLFFGTAIFAIEGISVVLPIENQMKSPRDMLGWNGVLNTSMGLVVGLYVAMGFYGYLKFGENIKGSITLNLPPGDMYKSILLTLYPIISQCLKIARKVSLNSIQGVRS